MFLIEFIAMGEIQLNLTLGACGGDGEGGGSLITYEAAIRKTVAPVGGAGVCICADGGRRRRKDE